MKQNGHKARAERVYYKAGDWVVVDDVWNSVVDGPHQMQRDGYKMARPGRRRVLVFDTEEAAMRMAQTLVETYVESEEE